MWTAPTVLGRQARCMTHSHEPKARPGPGDLSRRNLLVFGGAATVGLAALEAGGLGGAAPAHAAVTWYYPFTAAVQEGDGFGMRTHPIYGTQRMHNGIDFQPGAGAAIYSVAAGTVVAAGRNGGYGNQVQISHADGYTSAYAHMQDDSIRVAVGQSVSAGTLVGRVGSTGDSTGAHLHFEIMSGGQFVDPSLYVDATRPNPGAPVTSEIPLDDRNDSMRILRRPSDGNTYVVGARFIKHLQTSSEVDNNVKLWGGVVRPTSDAAFKQITDGLGIPSANVPAGGGGLWAA